MNTSGTRIHEAICKVFAARYPAFPITVMESPDDRLVLCARVFAVTTDKVREVKNAIRQIEHDLIPGGEYLLLPMVKNLETTRQHYPEYMPSAPAVSVAKMVEQFLLETVREPREWQPAKRGAICAADYRTEPARFGFDMGKIMGGQLDSAPKYKNAIPSNTELALAA